ncbi:unnamed protein product [Notodromas monacha]|uniref:Uncharacterized protein n=1 Tax=Notodromas monacha TaxID=399045 RepID=A0A7R9BHG9_9CRUS|nr:unnamed protein product [Notodromas monacha]CAG0914536.1 unnamed protein product [Notodromas monacha]
MAPDRGVWVSEKGDEKGEEIVFEDIVSDLLGLIVRSFGHHKTVVDGLYHEYKKWGKIELVRMIPAPNSPSERLAVVSFKKENCLIRNEVRFGMGDNPETLRDSKYCTLDV